MKSKKRIVVELIGIGLCSLILVFSWSKFEQRSVDAPSKEPRARLRQVNRALSTRSHAGFTLVPQSGTARVLLVNMRGEEVHRWNFDAQRARLLPNCNLLVVHGTKWGAAIEPWKSLGKKVREYDWNGDVVWEYDLPDKAHHDIQRLSNGNTLILYRSDVPESLRAGIRDPVRRRARFRSDNILEVDRDGKRVWNWHIHEHFDLNMCGRQPCPKLAANFNDREKREVDWSHVNTISVLPENKWYDAGDERFRPGNVVVLPRNWSTVFIVDRQSGKVVWQYSGDYEGGLSGGHEAHMIPKSLPGAGNMLIFDNGRRIHKGRSFILEINPQNRELAWVYTAGKEFFSRAAGSMQRLPNGNTLISSDVPGRVFEVTREGQVVWEYQSSARTCRAQRYEPDYCARFSELEVGL